MRHANATTAPHAATGVVIRNARPADEPGIQALVRGERLNPCDLQVEHFKVAERDGTLVGAAQIRKHGDGARELGSLVVAPGFRGNGIAAALIDALLEAEAGPVFMITGQSFAAHYERWQFTALEPRAAPPSIRFNFRMGRLGRVVSLLKRQPPRHLRILRRDPMPLEQQFSHRTRAERAMGKAPIHPAPLLARRGDRFAGADPKGSYSRHPSVRP